MISTLAPRTLRRRIERWLTRAIDAAGTGRRWQNAGTIYAWQKETAAANTTSRARARYLVGNDALASRSADVLTSAIVGTGIKPQTAAPAVNAAFEGWTDRADADGRCDWYGLQALAVRSLIVDGEAFLRFEIGPDGALRLRLIDPAQVDSTLTRDLGGGARIIAGVEFDAAGNRAAFHLFPARPGDPLAMNALSPIRVPASEIVHAFVPLGVGQVRGLSWFAPVLLQFHELHTLTDALLVAQRTAALFAGFIRDPEGALAGVDGTQSGSILESGLEPGALKVLPGNADITFNAPPKVDGSGEFLKSQLRSIAVGLGLTYEQLTGDLSGVNYSSIRAGMVEFRRRIEALQHHVVVFQLCRPVWDRWLRLEALRGAISPRDLPALLTPKWLPPGWQWVDPQSDVEADIAAMSAGIKSRREIVAARGLDIEALDAEIAADRKRAAALGLDFSAATTTPARQDNAAR